MCSSDLNNAYKEMHDAQMQDNKASNAWKVLQRLKELDQGPKRAQAQPYEPFLIQTERLFGMSVSREVRRSLEE